MDNYLEDIGAEIEINPDEVEYYDSQWQCQLKEKSQKRLNYSLKMRKRHY